MGVVNVTPDSFSDGGEWLDPAAAITHGMDLLGEGADIIDVGGESTQAGRDSARGVRGAAPGTACGPGTGGRRCLRQHRHHAPAVAAPAIAAGARLVNDVSGGRSDPGMLRLVADSGVPYVCMHWRGHSEDMQKQSRLRRCGDRGDR